MLRFCFAVWFISMTASAALADEPADVRVNLDSTSVKAAVAKATGAKATGAKAADQERQMRMVYDVAEFSGNLRLTVMQNLRQSWVLAAVMPDQTPRRMKQAADGQWMSPVEGTLDVQAVLNDIPAANPRAYKWEVLANRMADNTFGLNNWKGAFDHRFPFLKAGVVVCRLDDPDLGIYPSYLIPTEWSKDVVATFTYYRAHRELFDYEQAAKNRAALRQLTEDENPFLSLAAWSTLDVANQLDLAEMQQALRSSSGMKQAVLTHIFLKSVSDYAVAAQSTINDAIDAAANPADIEGIGLGLASTFHAALRDHSFTQFGQRAFSLSEVQNSMRKVKQKQQALR
jgi:hypothetical protein